MIEALVDFLAQAADLIDETTNWRLRGMFHVQMSHVSSLRGESEAALAECAKALVLARQHGDAALAARAQFQEGLERHLRWEFEAAVAALDAAWNYVSVNPWTQGSFMGQAAAAFQLAAANVVEARFVRITSQGLRESHVHDVIITEEAPNYFRS